MSIDETHVYQRQCRHVMHLMQDTLGGAIIEHTAHASESTELHPMCGLANAGLQQLQEFVTLPSTNDVHQPLIS
jgi:hypothetical protein